MKMDSSVKLFSGFCPHKTTFHVFLAYVKDYVSFYNNIRFLYGIYSPDCVVFIALGNSVFKICAIVVELFCNFFSLCL